MATYGRQDHAIRNMRYWSNTGVVFLVLDASPNPIKNKQLKNFGNNILCNERYQKNTIKKSRLVICTYPQTTFAESMYSGVPTMLFYDESLWQVQPIYSSLIDILKKANIIFTNKHDAANHVLQIQGNPMDWWISSDVKVARQEFNETCLTIDSDPVLRWKFFFQSLLDK